MSPFATHTPAAAEQDHAALIAAFEAGDLAGSERERAGALVATCAGCAELLADLAAVRVAVAALPAPRRTRDYRLTDEDAARLRPSLRNRLLGWLAAPRSSARPLAGALAAFGVAGLIFSATPGLLAPASSASAPVDTGAVPAAAGGEGTRIASPAASAAPAYGREVVPGAEPAPATAGPAIMGTDLPFACSAPLAPSGTAAASTNPGALAAGGSCSSTKNGSEIQGAGAAGPGDVNTGGNTGAVPVGAPPAGSGAGEGYAAPAASAAAAASPEAVDRAVTSPAAPAVVSGQPDRTLPLALSGALLAAGVLLFLVRLGARRSLR